VVVTVMVFFGGLTIGPHQLALLAGELLGLTAGFGLALGLGRRWIRSRDSILGKRSVLTGLIAPPTLGVALMFLEGRFGVYGVPGVLIGATAIGVLTGAYLGATMFLRSPRPPQPLDTDDVELLTSGDSLEDWFRTQEGETDLQPRDSRTRSAA
jgi:hypothetical protein